jgi:DNA mismatch repair protein MutS
MAGKSTYLRQNAIIVVLAHMGSFVPAERATIGICDQLFSRVGASDNLAAGQSTFMVEMSETANILNRATNRSFIIFDEIGRGTATYDGMAIAQSVLEYLNELKPRTLFATHYHELTSLVLNGYLNNVTCLTIDVREHNNDIIFMHKIVSGVANRSYGIQVAKMAGMPESVVARAECVLAALESNEMSVPLQSASKPAPRKKNTVCDNVVPQLNLFG